jgi:hypothetical protein
MLGLSIDMFVVERSIDDMKRDPRFDAYIVKSAPFAREVSTPRPQGLAEGNRVVRQLRLRTY